jgi:multicomponent Na+:H+ antiporter subunit D
MIMPVVLMTILILVMGFYAEPFIEYSMRAAEQVMDKDTYIKAVFPE